MFKGAQYRTGETMRYPRRICRAVGLALDERRKCAMGGRHWTDLRERLVEFTADDDMKPTRIPKSMPGVGG